jgi:GH15 family glucan-1,4-alpha-glucosidase
LEPGIKNDVDGAALSAISSGIISNHDEIKSAIERMQRLKMPSGGYRRVTCILTDPAIYEYWYERQEFLFIDFLMADAYLKLGMKNKADELIDRIVQKAALDNFFVPEMYVSEVNYRFKGPVGAATGAIPMVGYGAGVYILHLLERESARR